jgi:hypothetical protein
LAVVTIREVRKALDICAPDWKEHLTDHRIQIHWNGKIGRLPSGGHGKKNEFPIQWVRTLARTLGIVQCMKEQVVGLSSLRPPRRSRSL